MQIAVQRSPSVSLQAKSNANKSYRISIICKFFFSSLQHCSFSGRQAQAARVWNSRRPTEPKKSSPSITLPTTISQAVKSGTIAKTLFLHAAFKSLFEIDIEGPRLVRFHLVWSWVQYSFYQMLLGYFFSTFHNQPISDYCKSLRMYSHKLCNIYFYKLKIA